MTSGEPSLGAAGAAAAGRPRRGGGQGRVTDRPVTGQVAWLCLPGLLLVTAAAFLITRLT